MVDYCLGGGLERTPAIQQEFVAADLAAQFGRYTVLFERGAEDSTSVRVTWTDENGHFESVNAPLQAGQAAILGDEVFNLSDLIFHLCGVQPIKVRRSKLDPDSPLVRLSFRDLMFYCYLHQDHLDSSFFRMDDPFRRLKSCDAMRFVTGLYSERMNEIEIELVRAVNDQRSKRGAVAQIRAFMARFQMGTEIELQEQIGHVEGELREAAAHRDELDRTHTTDTHVVEPLRIRLRGLSLRMDATRTAIADIETEIQQHDALRSELIAAKIKADRSEQAGRVLEGVRFERCPQCGSDVSNRQIPSGACPLCTAVAQSLPPPIEVEVLRRDLNERIDDIAESMARHRRERSRQERMLATLIEEKNALDRQLSDELARYDSAYVASARAADRTVATLQERLASLGRLRQLPQAINDLEREAGELQGRIDNLRSALQEERARLRDADRRVASIADTFFTIIQAVGFPGVYPEDRVTLDPRNWMPYIHHGDQDWTFADAGSGGKKTLFNVCYALAVHTAAATQDLPLPTFLIIDSPTKNISQDENPDLVQALYREIYSLASREGRTVQFLLIDSDLVSPEPDQVLFAHRRMAHGESTSPPLISYYDGP
jgi:rubrerythrin